MALIACCLSRAIMIPTLSFFANWITSMRQSRANCCAAVHQLRRGGSNFGPGVSIDFRMQTVLWFAGLRGAMSFALVENIPLYDAVTGEGSRMKAELKAMTSASIIFTVFILGGCTDYIIERLGMAPSSKSETVEMTSLLGVANGINGEGRARERSQSDDSQPKKPRTTSRQRRGLRVV
jgi:NhaP-type Na+/H+ or K+/H+ antiporter